MPRQEVIRTSLANRGALIKVRDMDEACAIANSIAAEHLEISAEQPQQWADKIRHAGAMFLGRYSSEALGDYCAGRIMCCRLPAPRAFHRRWVCMISRNVHP
jgi:histidinol dehydrogenase